MGIQGVTKGYRGLQGVTRGYGGLQRVKRGYRGLQGVESRYKGLQGVTMGDKALQGFTKDYSNFFLTRTFLDKKLKLKLLFETDCFVVPKRRFAI